MCGARVLHACCCMGGMGARPGRADSRRVRDVRIMLLLSASSLLALHATTAVALEGPCDILGKAGNPCVAAHSTTRALFALYDGPLYNVSRPDGTWKSIGLLSAGGFANKQEHDVFCSKGDCVISNVYDQSPMKNHLGQRHGLINASRHPITIGQAKIPVYGMWFDPGFGYHVDNTTGIATGNDPESICELPPAPSEAPRVARAWESIVGLALCAPLLDQQGCSGCVHRRGDVREKLQRAVLF